MAIKCPYCGHEGMPLMVKEGLSGSGWAVFVILLLVCFPLCWLPFVVDGCKDEKRKCFQCGIKMG